MAVKIRLARKGRKQKAFYHIVVADSRSPRDGRYIERIGSYNPITNPAKIELDFDKALGWLQNGAIPTDTCRAILSDKGVMLKKHLLEGVKKGAFDDTEATRRFDAWMEQQNAKIEAKKSGLEKSMDDELSKQLANEKKVNEARLAKLAKKRADLQAKLDEAAKASVKTEEAEEVEEPTTPQAEEAEESTAPQAEEAEEPTTPQAEEGQTGDDKPQE